MAIYLWNRTADILPRLDAQLRDTQIEQMRPTGDAWKKYMPRTFLLATRTRTKAKGRAYGPHEPRPSQRKDGKLTPVDSVLVEQRDYVALEALFESILKFISQGPEHRRGARGDREPWKRIIAASCVSPNDESKNPIRDNQAFIAYVLLELSLAENNRPIYFDTTLLGEIRRDLEALFVPHLDPGLRVSGVGKGAYPWWDALPTPPAPADSVPTDAEVPDEDDEAAKYVEELQAIADHAAIQKIIIYVEKLDVAKLDPKMAHVDNDVGIALETLVNVSGSL